MIQENLKNAPSLKDQCQIVWEHYLSRKLNNNFEPNWIHQPYQVIKDFLDNKSLSDNDNFILREVIKSHHQNDGGEVPVKTGFPNEGIRLMHDYWKAGSFTWIFMGRIFCENIVSYKNNVIISRKLPDEIYILTDGLAPQILFASYKLEKPSFEGPAISLDQLISHLDSQEPLLS